MTPSTRLRLTVETPDGEQSVAFSPNHHVAAVLGEVLVMSDRPFDPAHYHLASAAGDTLAATDTLREAGVESDSTLRLEANPVSI